MLGIIKTAILSVSTALNPSPDDAKITEYNSGNENVKQKIEATKQVKAKTGFDTAVFGTEIQVGNTIQIPAKNEQTLTDPETKEKAETLVAKLVEIKDYTLIKAHLAENIATLDVEVLKEAVVVLTEMQISATKQETKARTNAIYYQNGMKRSHTYKPKYEKALKQEEEFNKEVSFLIGIESFVKDAIAIKNTPTAENITHECDITNKLPEIIAKEKELGIEIVIDPKTQSIKVKNTKTGLFVRNLVDLEYAEDPKEFINREGQLGLKYIDEGDAMLSIYYIQDGDLVEKDEKGKTKLIIPQEQIVSLTK